MTAKQYWEDDCSLVRYYRKAEILRTEIDNQKMWLQGRYIYDALVRVSPLFRSFTKSGTQIEPYTEKPYPITKESIEEDKKKSIESSKTKAMLYMETYAARHNKKFEERK